MFFFLSKTLDFLLMPLGLLFILLAYGAITTNRTRVRRTVVVVMILLYVLCNTFLVNQAFRWWEYEPRDIAAMPSGYDVGIVLTGGMIKMARPKADHPGFGNHADRFLQAYLLYKAGKIKKILISGGHMERVMKLRLDDGNQAARLLITWGVPAEDILLEGTSRNTRENAVNTAALLQKSFPKGKYLLITSSFHLRRAVGCFEKVGVPVTAFPADFYGVTLVPTLRDYLRPDPEIFGYAHFLWREWVGYLTYKAMGYC